MCAAVARPLSIDKHRVWTHHARVCPLILIECIALAVGGVGLIVSPASITLPTVDSFIIISLAVLTHIVRAEYFRKRKGEINPYSELP